MTKKRQNDSSICLLQLIHWLTTGFPPLEISYRNGRNSMKKHLGDPIKRLEMLVVVVVVVRTSSVKTDGLPIVGMCYLLLLRWLNNDNNNTVSFFFFFIPPH